MKSVPLVVKLPLKMSFQFLPCQMASLLVDRLDSLLGQILIKCRSNFDVFRTGHLFLN
jgi:hypothetical protein